MIKTLINSVNLNIYLKNKFKTSVFSTIEPLIKVGNVIQIFYNFHDGDKKKLQSYEGLIIKIKNKNLEKTFTLQHIIQNIKIEQIFFINSPNIVNIIKKCSYKIRKAKLYYIYNLYKKKLKLK